MWIRYAFNRLWQQSLSEEAGDAIQAAAQLGLTLRPLAYRARLVADGAVSGEPVRLEWRGGVRGAHTLLVRAGRREVLPLLTSASALHAALSPPT